MKHLKPKGKRGMAAVKRLGRNYKTGGFDRIAKSKGKGAAIAIYQNMVKKHLGQ
jgi:hypothetical protein